MSEGRKNRSSIGVLAQNLQIPLELATCWASGGRELRLATHWPQGTQFKNRLLARNCMLQDATKARCTYAKQSIATTWQWILQHSRGLAHIGLHGVATVCQFQLSSRRAREQRTERGVYANLSQRQGGWLTMWFSMAGPSTRLSHHDPPCRYGRAAWGFLPRRYSSSSTGPQLRRSPFDEGGYEAHR